MNVLSIKKVRQLGTVALVAVGLLVLSVSVGGQVVQAEEITSFVSEIDIREDASLNITEEIEYDFEGERRHGIFREVPVSYETDTGNRRIFLEVTEVTQDGEPAEYQTSREGDNLRVRIGDPDETITGPHTYEISYNVQGALNYFEDFDELYWNVTGNNWEVAIESAQADITLPTSVPEKELQYSCYSGPAGSDQECDSLRAGSSSVTARTQDLDAGEGLTVAVGFPKGTVEEPAATERLWWWLSANWIILLPFLVFWVMFYLWYTRGRDPEGRGTIMAQYEPPEGMRPTMVGALIDEKVHDKDITAGIIYLAEQGFLKIKRLEEKKLLVFDSVDYELTLKKDLESVPTETEKDAAEILFGSGAKTGESVRISDIKDDTSVAKKIKNLKKDVYQRMVEAGFFAKNPRQVIGWYWGVGFILGWLIVVLAGFSGASFVSVMAGIASGVIVVVFGYLMPRKTKQGALTKEHLKGFKHFLSMTQKKRLEFHNAPERTTEEFMEFLPYAVALGIEEEWAGQFDDMYIETPGWYEGGVSGRVAAGAFASDLSDATSGIAKGVNSAAASGSSGSSGGVSGGGMGGGGGGSW